MRRRPPRSTRTDTLFPYPTLFRSALMEEVSALKARLPELEAEERRLGEELDTRLAAIPNIPAADVPDGADEEGNRTEERRVGKGVAVSGDLGGRRILKKTRTVVKREA